jgi:hypothetical protein
LAVVWAVCGCLAVAAHGLAQDTQTVRRELGAVRNLARRAADLQRAGKLEDAAAALTESQERLAKVLDGAKDEARKQAQSAWQSLQATHAALQLEGVTLPSLQPLTVLMTAAGPGISYTKAVAPILVKHCGRCHIERQEGGLALTSYSSLMNDAPGGAIVVPGDAEGSRLLDVIESGDMPRGGGKLSPPELETLRKWIAAGAKFDGTDANQGLEIVAATARAEQATDEQLRADRDKLAAAHWRVVLPDSPAERVQTAGFLLLGNVSDRELTGLGEQAKALAPRISKLLKLPDDRPPLKGGATLYFFRTGHDYGEFGRMVEKRELPPHWRAHFGHDVVDAYAAFHLTGQDDDTRETLLAQQIASLYVAGQGSVPAWFAQGVGRAVAARLVGGSPLVADWMDRAQGAMPQLQTPGEFLQGRPSVEAAEALSYRYADFLLRDMRRFQKLLETVRTGRPFAESFEQAYGGSPEQVAATWIVRESQRGR